MATYVGPFKPFDFEGHATSLCTLYSNIYVEHSKHNESVFAKNA